MHLKNSQFRITWKNCGVLLVLLCVCGLFGCGNTKKFEPKELEDAASYMSLFYVSPFGDDSNTGNYEAPFKTIGKAQEMVRTVNKNMSSDIAVVIREGNYSLSSSLKFTNADSGTNGHNVKYMAYPGEEVVLSGGVKLDDWENEGNNIYSTNVSAEYIRNLYVNGERAVLARYPNGNTNATTNQWDKEAKKIRVYNADLKGATDFEVVLYMEWAEVIANVDSISVNGAIATLNLAPLEAEYMFSHSYHEYQYRDDMLCYYQNAYEFLDTPGEFYYDKEAGKLYYIPREGENMKSVEIIAPALSSVIKIEGSDYDKKVSNLCFEGLTIEHSAASDVEKYGFLEMQTGHYAMNRNTGSYYGHDVPKGAVQVKNAENLSFVYCTVKHSGGTGINFYYGVRNSSIIGCRVDDTSASGIIIAPFIDGVIRDQSLYLPTDDNITCNHITISNNYITRAGMEYHRSAALVNVLGYRIEISNNEVAYSNYSGISNGWGWSQNEYVLNNNIITRNNVHHIGMMGNDLGGIYNLNNQPGSEITYNYIHEIGKTGLGLSPLSPTDGIYLDEGTNNMNVSYNQIAYANEQLHVILFHSTGDIIVCENNKGLLQGDTLDQKIIAAAGVQGEYRKILDYLDKEDNRDVILGVVVGNTVNDEAGLYGYRLKVNETVVLEGLGRFYLPGNNQKHTLSIYNQNKEKIASCVVDMASGDVDMQNFVYANFSKSVTLSAGEEYYVVSEEFENGDLYLSNNSQMYLSEQFSVLGIARGENLSSVKNSNSVFVGIGLRVSSDD